MPKKIYIVSLDCGHKFVKNEFVKPGRHQNCPECMARKRVVACEESKQ